LRAFKACGHLKGFCATREWAGSAAALLGVGLLLGTVWVAIDFNVGIRAWVARDLLVHGLALGVVTLADVLLIFGFLCLGFSECAPGDRRCAHAYRGRRSAAFPELVGWIDGLGTNPRRLPRRG
jgi:hypothetical protein